MKKIFFYFFIFSSILLFGNDFKVINLENKNIESSSFPYFSSKKYLKSAENINTILQVSYFEKLLTKKMFFKKTTNPFFNNSDHIRNLYIYSYKTTETTNFLSISLHLEYCGAYCEGDTNYINIDKHSGQIITLEDLFNKKNLEKLEKVIKKKNINKIKSYIKKPAKKSTYSDIEEYEYDEGQYNLYTSCLEQRKNDSLYFNKLENDTKFLLTKNKLEIYHGRCSNHAGRALDEIGDFVNTFTFKQLNLYLDKKTKKYLSSNKKTQIKLNSNYKIWKGKIANKYPITLAYPYGGFWTYWYDKYKKPIELYKERNTSKNILIFDEKFYNKQRKKMETTGIFNLKKENGILKGTYTRKRDSKTMSVLLKVN